MRLIFGSFEIVNYLLYGGNLQIRSYPLNSNSGKFLYVIQFFFFAFGKDLLIGGTN